MTTKYQCGCIIENWGAAIPDYCPAHGALQEASSMTDEKKETPLCGELVQWKTRLMITEREQFDKILARVRALEELSAQKQPAPVSTVTPESLRQIAKWFNKHEFAICVERASYAQHAWYLIDQIAAALEQKGKV